MISIIGYTLVLSSVLTICFFTERAEFEFQFLFWAIGFIGYLILCLRKVDKSVLPKLIAAAFIIRLIACFSFPVLSDDIYRFIWDGELNIHNISVYEFKPSQVPENTIPDQKVLFENLNSKDYFSVYPPINQAIFTIGAYLGNSVFWKTVIIKLILLLGEISLLLLIQKVLKVQNAPPQRILLYAFNPLIIIEICGNAHFEGLALLALITTAYLIFCNKYMLSAIPLFFAVLIKLNPLIYLPLIVFRIKKRVQFILLLFILLATVFIIGFKTKYLLNAYESLSYYFVKFEFNSGIYYLIRSFGYYLCGYNAISIIGPLLCILSGSLIFYMSLKNINGQKQLLIEAFLYICSIHLFFSTVIHPWYLIPLIGFSIFTNLRFPLFWSFLIFISYHIYEEKPYNENMFLVYLEYIFLLIWVIIEVLVPKWQKAS